MPTSSAALIEMATGLLPTVSPDRLELHQFAGTAQIIDVREADERHDLGWIATSIHVPRGLLEFWADPASASHRAELDPTVPTVVYCAAGQRSVLAGRTLHDLGYVDVAWLEGGIEQWTRSGKPVAGLAPWHRNDLSTNTNEG